MVIRYASSILSKYVETFCLAMTNINIKIVIDVADAENL